MAGAAGLEPANQVAHWNGTNWSALGSGIDGEFRDLAVSDSGLYIVSYTRVQLTNYYELEKSTVSGWDGSTWTKLFSITNVHSDYGPYARFNTLAVSGPPFALYAGGTSNSAPYVIRWDGNTWADLSSGLTSLFAAFPGDLVQVTSLAVLGTDLVGAISVYGCGWSDHYVVRRTGTTWSILNTQAVSKVSALVVSGTNLFEAGYGKWGQSPKDGYVARWDGGARSIICEGLDGPPWSGPALALSVTDVYIGGDFTRLGQKVLPYVAKAQSLVACDVSCLRAMGASLQIPVNDLAADLVFRNPITVQSVGPSAEGALLNWNANSIFCSPVNDNDDAFNYTVSDGTTTATGSITVAVAPLARNIALSGGGLSIRFLGRPGFQYDVQRTFSLANPVVWTVVTPNPLSPTPDGAFTYTDTNAIAGAAYYRALRR